jgi:hypothetical protein
MTNINFSGTDSLTPSADFLRLYQVKIRRLIDDPPKACQVKNRNNRFKPFGANPGTAAESLAAPQRTSARTSDAPYSI